jgi:hypothetical protein
MRILLNFALKQTKYIFFLFAYTVFTFSSCEATENPVGSQLLPFTVWLENEKNSWNEIAS